MDAQETIKLWNKKKGTRLKLTPTKNELINDLITEFGEDNFTSYMVEMINTTSRVEDAIIPFLQKQKYESWLKSKQPKIEEQPTILKALSQELIKLMGVDFVNQVNDIIQQKIDTYVENKVLTKVVQYNGQTKKVNGITHEKFDTISKFVAMNEPVMLVGPAGTGKNVIIKQVAEALNLDFYFSNAVTQEYKLTGYGDANGNFVKTQFYEAFTKGGIFLLDEIDASIPEALIVLNCAIANGYFDFPVVGKTFAHPDFRVVACANTFGTGADSEYVGRNQLDAATLNRFAIVEVDYSPKIENAICEDIEILKFCREFRNACQHNGVHHIVSYREIQRLNKMINVAQLEKKEAIQTCLTKGLEKDTLRMIYSSMNESEYKEVLKELL